MSDFLDAHLGVYVRGVRVGSAQTVVRHFRIGSVDNDIHLPANLSRAPGKRHRLLLGHEGIAPRDFHFFGKMAVKPLGGRAGLQGIRKNAQPFEVLFFGKVDQLVELRLGFPREAYDKGRP